MEKIEQPDKMVNQEKNKLEIFCEKYFHVIFWSILAIASIIWFSLSFHKQLWLDEVYTLQLVKYNFYSIWQRTALDVHPPLYYFLLKIFLLPFKNAQLGGRLFSVIPFLLIAILGGLKIKKFFGVKYSLLFIISFCFFPGTLKYSVDIRMYSLSAAFVFFCGLYAYEAYQDNTLRGWITFTAMGICAAYTHYFAFVSIIIVHLILIIALLCNKGKRKLWWKWLVCVAASILLYSPWAANFIGQLSTKVTEEYWIPPITIKTIYSYFKELFGGNIFYSITYLSIIIIGCIYTFITNSKTKKLVAFLSLGCLLGTIMLGVIASLIIRPVFIIRYAIPCVPILCVFLALTTGEIKNNIVKLLCVFAMLGVFIPCSIGTFQTSYSSNDDFITEKTIELIEDCECIAIDFTDNNDFNNTDSDLMFALFISYYNPDVKTYIKNAPNNLIFDNVLQLDNFDANNYSKICLIIPEGDDIPNKYLSKYDICRNGKYFISGQYVDFYVLVSQN